VSKAADAPLREVPFKVTHPERIPAKRYYDKDFFELEREHFWPHVWQMACRLEEIPNLGDWVEYKILDKSVIVVRGKNGVQAFHNACRHRGVQLASGHGNCKSTGFICPFHGWRFSMDGENTFVFGKGIFSEEALDQAELNLVPCRTELWGGCAFINFDNDAPPLLDTMQPIADRLNVRNVDKLMVEWWVSSVLPTNWKLAMEAFMEGYHVMKTHPQLYSTPHDPAEQREADVGGKPARALSSRQVVETFVHHMDLLGDGMGGMISQTDREIARELLEDFVPPEDPAQTVPAFMLKLNDEITTRARAKGIDMPDLNYLRANNPAAPVEFIFPHYFLLPQFGNMSSYRIRPLTEETCLFELWSLMLYPEDEQRERPTAPTPMPHDSDSYPAIPQQDYSNLPLQQLGLHAGGFEYMRLSKDVEGLISNYQRTIDGFLEGRDKDELAKAISVASGSLGVPIQDIGF
jgi:phenylpropionate dioxygenase-like ring-hydroxylating dioxygenase large terminal subunit